MKKIILFLTLLSSIPSNAQYVIENTFKPLSFREMVAPYLIYKQAYEQAVEQIVNYFSKAKECMEKGNFSLAKTYLCHCQQLNNRYNGEICSSNDLSQLVDYCPDFGNRLKKTDISKIAY